MSSRSKGLSSQNEIEASAASVAPVRPADRRNLRRMAGYCEPVVNRGANPSALDGRVARSMVASDQQHDALVIRDRLIERPVDRRPGRVQAHAMEVEDAIRLQAPASNPLVPTPIEGLVGDRYRFLAGSRLSHRRRTVRLRSHRRRSGLFTNRCGEPLSRKRADRRRYAAPKLGFFRAERAHARLCPWESGSAPRR